MRGVNTQENEKGQEVAQNRSDRLLLPVHPIPV
jgi:hypothetical protein